VERIVVSYGLNDIFQGSGNAVLAENDNPWVKRKPLIDEFKVASCKLQVGRTDGCAQKVSRIWSDLVRFTRMAEEAVVKKSQKLDRFFTDFFTGRGWSGWIWLDWV
jgi:hypothetical protein